MEEYIVKPKQEDIDTILGEEAHCKEEPEISMEKQKEILRLAQNANRGHPRKGEKRPKLVQLNVRCAASLVRDLDNIALASGKTKRTLIEESIQKLKNRYTYTYNEQ